MSSYEVPKLCWKTNQLYKYIPLENTTAKQKVGDSCEISIGSDNDLAPIQTNNDLLNWRIYASRGPDELMVFT